MKASGKAIAAPARLPEAGKEPLRVLMVENDAEDAELCLKELERSGFVVRADVVQSAEEFGRRLTDVSGSDWEANASAGTVRRPKPLILVVDDEPMARELIVNYLGPAGYDTIAAASGSEALLLAVERRPDGITLNMLTPGKAGWNTLRELKSRAETAAIPVILVSIIDRKKLGFSMGAAEYLMKPISKEALLGALRKHVKPTLEAPPSVLVVDDEPDDLQVMTEVLQSAGYNTLTAGGGREALRVLKEQRPDAVLLDLLMPEVDGFEVLQQLKGNDELRDLPVFVLTAKELTELDVETLRRDTRQFFRKELPWKEELLKQVQRAVGTAAKILPG
jgi:CheY-like chemotaxis protein